MIESLSLSNFKCFRSQALGLSSLNLLAGINGAGKSTVVQSLLALRQSWESGSLFSQRLQLNGRLCELGTARETYCSEPDDEFIEISLASTKMSTPLNIRCRYSEGLSAKYFMELDQHPGRNLDQLGLFSDSFNYLHAERLGPRKVFQIPPEDGHELDVGSRGEKAAFVVSSVQRELNIVNESLLIPNSEGRTLESLHNQWRLWMARFFPGFDAESEIMQEVDQGRLALALQQRETGQSLFVRPTNTGFGVSFVFGIVVAGLVARPDTVLIVENPEAHLHPRAQSCVGEFLARVAAGGAQVFVETHSEHVLNGMRRMVKQTVIGPDDISLHYFDTAPSSFEPRVTPISVSENGDISKWPDGFFDQLDQDLSILLD